MSLLPVLALATLLGGAPGLEPLIALDGERITDIVYSNDGTALFTASDEVGRGKRSSWIRRVDVDGGRVAWSIERKSGCSEIATSPDGGLLATSKYGGGWYVGPEDQGFEIRSADSGEVVDVVETPSLAGRTIEVLAFTRNGKSIVACSGTRVVEVNLTTDARRKMEVPFSDEERTPGFPWGPYVTSWAISSDLNLVAAGGSRDVLHFMKLERCNSAAAPASIGEAHFHPPMSMGGGPAITAVTFSPDRSRLAVAYDGSGRREIVVSKVDGMRVEEMRRVSVTSSVDDLFYCEGADVIVGVSSDRVSVWKLMDNSEVVAVKFDAWSIDCAAFSPGRREVSLGCRDGRILTVDLTVPLAQRVM